MKAFRIAMLGLALVAGSAAVASAQATPQQQGRGGARSNQLKDISLTAEQQARIDEINKKYAPEMQILRESMQGGGDRAEGMKKMNDLRTKISPEIRGVLTAEQQVIFDKNMAEMKARMDAMAKPPAI